MTADQARAFLQRVLSSKVPAISRYRALVEARAAAYLARQAAQRTAEKLECKVAGAAARTIENQVAKKASQKLFTKAAAKVAGAASKKIPIVAAVIFVYKWREGGFRHAVNDALWPISEMWGGE